MLLSFFQPSHNYKSHKTHCVYKILLPISVVRLIGVNIQRTSRISVVGVLETFRNLIFFVHGKFRDSCQTNTEEVNKHLLGLFFVFLEHNTLNTHHNLDPWNVRIYKRITHLKGFPSFPISRETYSFIRKYIVYLWLADRQVSIPKARRL